MAVELRVTASGVTGRIVREWGGVVGERIVPRVLAKAKRSVIIS
jgi:hypothetical protein